MKGGYKEVDKLACQTTHIEAIRNELWIRSYKPTNETDWKVSTWEMKFLPLPVQPCMLRTRGLLGDGFLKGGLNIYFLARYRNRHKIDRRAGRPSMPSHSSDNQVLSNVLPHQVLREQTLQPAKLIFMLDLEVFEAWANEQSWVPEDKCCWWHSGQHENNEYWSHFLWSAGLQDEVQHSTLQIEPFSNWGLIFSWGTWRQARSFIPLTSAEPA